MACLAVCVAESISHCSDAAYAGMAGHSSDSMADAYACKVAEALSADKLLTKLTLPRESLARIMGKKDKKKMFS